MLWLRRTLLLLLPMVMILAIGAFVLLRPGRIDRHLRSLLVQQLSESIDRPVDIESARLVRRNLLRLDGVRIAGSTAKSPPLLRAGTVLIRFRWRALLLGRQPVISTIEQVTVVEPEANIVRRADGRWEVQDLFKPAKPPRGRFQGTVAILRGRATIRDHAAPTSVGRPAVNHIEGLRASITVTPDRTVTFSMSGRSGNRAGHISAEGASRSDRFVIDARVTDASLAYAWRYLNLSTALSVEAGRGDAHIYFGSTAHPSGGTRQINYVVSTSLKGARVRLRSISTPFTSVTGRVVVVQDSVNLSGIRARFGGSDISLDGTVAHWQDPVLRLEARAQDAQIKDLSAAMPGWSVPKWIVLPETISVEASISGAWHDPEVVGTARWGRFGLGPVRWAEGDSPFRYHDRRIDAGGLVARGEGGEVRGKGWVSWASPVPRAAFEATVSAAELGPLAARVRRLPTEIAGLASGSVTIGYDEDGLRVLAPLVVTDARVGKVRLDRIDTVAKYEGGCLDVSGTDIHTEYGDVFVQGGTTASGELSFLALAGDVDIAALSGLLGQSVAGGRGYVIAHVGGTLENPQVAARAEAVDVEIKGEKFGLVTLDLAGDARSLEVTDARLWWRGGEITAAGEIRDIDYRRRRATLDLGVKVAGLPLAELAAGAKTEIEAVGVVAGQFDVGGEIADPQVTGRIMVDRPVVAGQGMDSAAAEIAYQNRVLTVKRASVTVDGQERATLSGTIDAERNVALQFAADDYPLRDLAVRAKGRRVLINGAVHGSGRVGGSLRRPQIEARLRAPQLTVDGEQVQDVAVNGTWSEQRGIIHHLTAAIGEGSLQGRAVVDLGARRFDVEVTGEALPLGRLIDWGGRAVSLPSSLREALGRLPRPVVGALSTQAHFQGEFGRPLGEATIKIDAAEMAGHALPTLTARASLEGKVITLERLTAEETGGPASVEAKGTIDLAGDVGVSIDVHNLNAGLFAPWLRDGIPLGGSADISADLTGPVRSPVVRGSVEIEHPKIGPVGLDALQVAAFRIEGGRISIPEDGPLLAVREGRAIRIHGSVPFSWRSPVFPADQPVDLRVQMPEGNLSMLASLIPGLAAADGPLALDMRIGGVPAQPQLEGSLTVADGGIESIEGLTPLVGLKADIRFEGDTVRVAALSGTVGGGRVWVEPGGTMNVRRWSPARLHDNAFDLRLRVDHAVVAYDRVGSVVVDADLSVANAEEGDARAQIGGQVTIVKGLASALPTLPEAQVQKMGPLPFDPDLDVTLRVEPNLAIKTSTMDVVLRGDGKLGGRLSEANAQIGLAIERGSFSFPGATFRFREGSIDVAAEVGEPVRATIEADAEARVHEYHVYLHVSGPLTDPKISTQSVPYLTEEEILALLTGRGISPLAATGMTPQQALESEFRTLLTAGLRQTVLSPIERELAASIGLSELTFAFGTQDQPVVVRAGSYLSDRIYLQHIRSLGGAAESSLIRGAYRIYFNPPIWLGYSIDERQTRRWELETHFRF